MHILILSCFSTDTHIIHVLVSGEHPWQCQIAGEGFSVLQVDTCSNDVHVLKINILQGDIHVHVMHKSM